MGTSNKYKAKIKKRKQISDSVFNLLFKDLVESEKIKVHMEEWQKRIYAGEMKPYEYSACISSLTDQYIKKEMNTADRASIIRYMSAFAKIENNVKATLCVMRIRTCDEDDLTKESRIAHIVGIYEETQRWINRWAETYALTHQLQVEWVSTPNLEWIEK
ncbi:hypothetical protein JQN58_01130 [Aneurinibacillus sp. BA2021]|nr:hypothetical protein [Aneurinibacillus sp. BA2021]